jgi:hypothetical protein
MTGGNNPDRVDLIIMGKDTHDRIGPGGTQVPIIDIAAVNGDGVGMPFDVEGNIGILVKYIRELGQGEFSLRIQDSAAGRE